MKSSKRIFATVIAIIMLATIIPLNLYTDFSTNGYQRVLEGFERVHNLYSRLSLNLESLQEMPKVERPFSDRPNGTVNSDTEGNQGVGVLADCVERCRKRDLSQNVSSQSIRTAFLSENTEYLPQDKAVIIACLVYGTQVVSFDDVLVKALTGEEPNDNLFTATVNYTASVWDIVEYSAPADMGPTYFGQCISLLNSFVDFYNHFEALINPYDENTSLQVAVSALQVINDIFSIFGYPVPGVGAILSSIQFGIQIATVMTYQIFYNETIPLYIAERAIEGYTGGNDTVWPQKPIYMSEDDYEQIMISVDIYCSLKFNYSQTGEGFGIISSTEYNYEPIENSSDISITGISNENTEILIIPSSINGHTVTEIGVSAFQNNSYIEEVILPDTIENIGCYAFKGCSALSLVQLNEGLRNIYFDSFTGCSKMVNIFLPASLENISVFNIWLITIRPFTNCKSLENIWVDSANTHFTSLDGVLYSKDLKELIVYPAGRTALTYNIPNTVETIGQAAFNGCVYVQNINLPNSLLSIEDRAFQKSSITNMQLPDTLPQPEIFRCVFLDCKNLTDLTFPASWKSIEGERPQNFYGYNYGGCINLQNIYFPANMVETTQCLDDTAWYNNQPDGLIYAGKVLYGYKGIMPMNTSVSLRTDTVGIGSKAFSGCTELKGINIPSSLINICDSAFLSCSNLIAINMPESVMSIGNNAFCGCSHLFQLTIPTDITSIGARAFENCTGLQSINFNALNCNDISSFGIFTGCNSLQTANIGNNVIRIPANAFSGCSGLTSVTIPKSVTSIGSDAFKGCGSCTIFGIPGSYAQTYAISMGIPFVPITIIKPTAGSGCVVDKNNKMIYGIAPGITKQQFESQYIQLGNGYSAEYSSATLGTGTMVTIFENDAQSNGTVVASYSIVIFGDVNGDSNIDTSDSGNIIDYENFIITWDTINDSSYMTAADLNGDGNIDTIDADIIVDAENYILTINQITGLAVPV